MEFYDADDTEPRAAENSAVDIMDVGNDEDDYDDDAITPAEVLSQLTAAWQNELAAPTLLPHRFDVTDCMIDQTSGMQENLKNHRDKLALKHLVHKMELHRIEFVINDYIRKRLKKIESNPRKYLAEDDARKRDGKEELLDARERSFAQRFLNSTTALTEKCFLGDLPPGLRKIPVPEGEEVSGRVFVEVKADEVGEVTVPDMSDPLSELLVNLEQNSTHLIPFSSISKLVEANKVLLL